MSYANINGYLSSPIYIFRCLRQGSPLSPILFLKLSMRRDKEGITVQGADITVLASIKQDRGHLFFTLFSFRLIRSRSADSN